MKNLTEKEAFSQRLKEQLAHHDWPTTSPTWLAREFNLRYSGQSISVQTASNWLSGTTLPNQDKLQILSAWLNVSSQWLRFGEDNNTKLTENHFLNTSIPLYLDDLPNKIAKLKPKQKYLVYELVEALLEGN